MRGGDKAWQHIKQGVPIRVEIGPRDIANGTVSIARRDEPPKQKHAIALNEFPKMAAELLDSIQSNLLEKAVDFRDRHSSKIDNKDEIPAFFDASQQDISGFAYVHVADDPAVAKALDPLKVTVRCTPMDWEEEPGKCLFTGKTVGRRSVISRSY
jgi:prolyl-tRNA synthetase